MEVTVGSSSQCGWIGSKCLRKLHTQGGCPFHLPPWKIRLPCGCKHQSILLVWGSHRHHCFCHVVGNARIYVLLVELSRGPSEDRIWPRSKLPVHQKLPGPAGKSHTQNGSRRGQRRERWKSTGDSEQQGTREMGSQGIHWLWAWSTLPPCSPHSSSLPQNRERGRRRGKGRRREKRERDWGSACWELYGCWEFG